MRRIIAFLSLTTALVAANSSDLPKNLLRYNMGALPMAQNANGQWTDVTPDAINWNAPYAAVLAGDVGKTLDLSSTKTFVVDLAQVESINRFSLFSKSATGSLAIYSSPVFENPENGKWSELGTLTLEAGKASTLTSTPTDARYIKFVFSSDSKGVIGSMGAFGNITYGDVRAPDLTGQSSTVSTQAVYSLNYATPATQMTIVSSTPAHTADELLPLFADDPASTFTVSQPTVITVDMSAPRQVSSGYILSSGNANASVRLGATQEDLQNAKPMSVMAMVAPRAGYMQYGSMGADDMSTARFAQISIQPGEGSTTIGGISLVGPVDPRSFVFDRSENADEVAAPANTPSALPPVNPIVPRITTF